MLVADVSSHPRLATLLLCSALSVAACRQILGIPDVTVADATDGGGAGGGSGGSGGVPGVDAAVDQAAGGGSGGGGASDAATDTTAPADAGPASCDGGQRACGGACVDVAASRQNCGACGHSCGGGDCARGVCQPEVLTGTDVGTSVAVGATDIFFTIDTRLLACPKDGCVLAPRQVGNNSPMDVSDARAANGSVFFVSAPVQSTIRPALYLCPPDGCTSPLRMVSGAGFSGPSEVAFAGDDVYWLNPDGGALRNTCPAGGGPCTGSMNVGPKGFSALSASATEFYFADTAANGGGLSKCPRDGCATLPGALPTKLAPGTPTGTAYAGGVLYVQLPGRAGFSDGSIRTCTPTDCNAGVPARFVDGRESPSGVVADATGVYWIEGGAILACALPACSGGARTLASSVSPAALVLDDAFVYWTNGSPGPIMRVAK
jgi:hypothetical protein